MLLPQCPVEVEECIFSVVLQVLTACGWEEGRGGGGGSAKVRGFNPHVFDWPTVCEGMCLVRVLVTNQVG